MWSFGENSKQSLKIEKKVKLKQISRESERKMAGQVVQGIDTLTSAMKGNIIPDQEYLLQGSLLDSHIEVFKHRLRGLCDNTLGGEEQFCEREMVCKLWKWIE